MLTVSFFKLAAVLFLSAAVVAKPVGRRQASGGSFPSFNNFDGRSSLSNFDGFNGVSNFDGSRNKQVIVKQETVVCEQIDVTVIQQRLAVIREFVKRVIVEQVCETEVQTVVLEQFNSGLDSFGRDVRRQSGRSVSFDSEIASFFSELIDESGSLTNNNFGFSGSSIGSNSVSVNGGNWNDATSPSSVGSIYSSAMNARNSAQNINSTQPITTTTATSNEVSTTAATSKSTAASKSTSTPKSATTSKSTTTSKSATASKPSSTSASSSASATTTA